MLTLPDKIYCANIPRFTAKEQEHIALNTGRPPRDIFIDGRGAENFAACVSAIRGTGTLGLVGGLRILGSSRTAIMGNLRLLKERNILPYNLETGVSDIVELLDEAILKINGQKTMMGDPKRPKKMGRRGGLQKGVRAQEYRTSIINPDIVRRLCACHKLTYDDCSQILGGPPFSASTLRRQFPRNK